MALTTGGSSIHACRNVNRHIAAVEADAAIFKALLAPLVRTSTPSPIIVAELPTTVDGLEGEEVVVERIVKKSRLSK